jgi:sporadic carbohydrate cluster protein (TIGR04323 family)
VAERHGHRGYIGSRPYMGERAAQHVQNLVIRDYCQRNGLVYLLSATEYAMANCYVMLEEVLRELPQIEGIVMYSLFMLPERPETRASVFERVLGAGASLHGALENLSVRTTADAGRVEDILRINHSLRNAGPADLAGLHARL